MTTLDDQATAFEELDRELCLKRRVPELPKTGKCYNCGDATEGTHCSPECREDDEKRIKFNGK